MSRKSGNILVIALATLLLLSISTAGYLINKTKDQSLPQALKNITELARRPKLETPAGWETYTNNTIGLEFKYPPSWGKPQLGPSEEITNLSTVNEDYRSPNNLYDDSIRITFPGDSAPKLEIFDKSHKGEFNYDLNKYSQKYIDGFEEVTRTGEICPYKFSFDYQPFWGDSYKEIYNDCFSGIKTSLTESVNSFTYGDDTKTGAEFTKSLHQENRYSYELLNSFYKKLQNGVFDDLVVKQQVGSINSIATKLNGLDTFLRETKITEAELKTKRTELETFMDSTRSFKPIPVTPPAIESTSADPNINAITNYYSLLTNRQFEKAYNMRATKSEDYSTFSSWYKNIFYARPYNFKKLTGNKYLFFVEYQDNNKPKQKYRVMMEVEGNKVTTNSSEQIFGKEIEYKNMKAFVKQESGQNYVVLAENGVEKNIDKGPAKPGDVSSKGFQVIRFTPNGRYLLYATHGWEWGALDIFDIKESKNVKELDAAGFYEITKDGKYLTVCASDHFGGARYGLIYDLENQFSNVFDFEKVVDTSKAFDLSCKYDQINDALVFSLLDDRGRKLEAFNYNFSSRTLSPVK